MVWSARSTSLAAVTTLLCLKSAMLWVALPSRKNFTPASAILLRPTPCRCSIPRSSRDLDLPRHGLTVVEREISNFLPLDDGSYLKVGGGKTKSEVAKFSNVTPSASTPMPKDWKWWRTSCGIWFWKRHPTPRAGVDCSQHCRNSTRQARWAAALSKLSLEHAARGFEPVHPIGR